MPSIILDRNGISQNTPTSIKTPCVAATLAPITLSASATATTIDGVTIAVGDRIAVGIQGGSIITPSTDNGIYIVGSTGWTRAPDFNSTGHCVRGTIVPIAGGTSYGGYLFYVDSSGINVPDGSSKINFIPLTI